jgi:hypothetical membrane protein
MFLNLLHFGSGLQAIHYFIFCLVGLLGTMQGVAVWYHRNDLLWLDQRKGYALSALMVAGSFIWFFLVDQDIFIPGLAGGELFTLFAAAFVVAVLVTRVVAFLAARVRASSVPERTAREKEPLS